MSELTVNEAWQAISHLRRRRGLAPQQMRGVPPFTCFCANSAALLPITDAGVVFAGHGSLFDTVALINGVTSVRRFVETRGRPHLGRSVASGGARYPTELYIYVRDEEVAGAPEGLYHYDAGHHAVSVLGAGDVWEAMVNVGMDIEGASALILFGAVFDRTYERYGPFSQRLVPQDVGVVLGQAQLLMAALGVQARASFLFSDAELARALGTCVHCEPVYVALRILGGEWARALTIPAPQATRPRVGAGCHASSEHGESRYASEFVALHEAASGPAPDIVRGVHPGPTVRDVGPACVALPPPVPVDGACLVEALQSRHSPGESLGPAPLDQQSLSDILAFASDTPWDDDLAEWIPIQYRPRVLITIGRVSGVASGTYAYHSQCHSLNLIRSGDFRYDLQSATYLDTINFAQLPACVHIAGAAKCHMDRLGVRGFRIQQMLVGAIAHRIQIASAARGCAAHFVLGFDCDAVASLYRLDVDEAIELQVAIGRTSRNRYMWSSLVRRLL